MRFIDLEVPDYFMKELRDIKLLDAAAYFLFTASAFLAL